MANKLFSGFTRSKARTALKMSLTVLLKGAILLRSAYPLRSILSAQTALNHVVLEAVQGATQRHKGDWS